MNESQHEDAGGGTSIVIPGAKRGIQDEHQKSSRKLVWRGLASDADFPTLKSN